MNKSLLLLAAMLVFSSCAVVVEEEESYVEEVPVVEETSTEPSVYEDEYISFEYPEEMVLLRDQEGEGGPMFTLDWIAEVEGESYFQTIGRHNPQLRYPYNLAGSDYESWEALKADKMESTDALTTTGNFLLGGQDAVLVSAGGFCEHYYELYVEGPTGVVYSLTAGCVNDESWESLYNSFEESVVFKQ
ncbi:MAG: hypothetical protein AAB802_04725 [Patescibacteria group bacterium]